MEFYIQEILCDIAKSSFNKGIGVRELDCSRFGYGRSDTGNWGKAFLFSLVVLGLKMGGNLACLFSEEKGASGS